MIPDGVIWVEFASIETKSSTNWPVGKSIGHILDNDWCESLSLSHCEWCHPEAGSPEMYSKQPEQDRENKEIHSISPVSASIPAFKLLSRFISLTSWWTINFKTDKPFLPQVYFGWAILSQK